MKLEDVIYLDTLANQPAATAVPIGTLYSITDRGNLVQRSNGTSWVDFNTGLMRGTPTVTDFEDTYSNIVSQAITISEGDAIYFRIFGTIFNGTGGNRTWTIGMTMAGETLEFAASAVAANTTSTGVFVEGWITIHTSAVTRFMMKGRLNPASTDDTMITDVERSIWSFSAADFTGSQTLVLKIKSGTAGAGASFRAGYVIEHLKA